MFDQEVLVGLKVAVLAIFGDAVIGWSIAAFRNEFDIRKMVQFVKTNILPYMAVLMVLAVMAMVDQSYKAVFFAITAMVTAKFSVEALKDKLMGFLNERLKQKASL